MGIYGRECCGLQTAALKASRFCKLATVSGREFHCTIASGEKIIFILVPRGVDLHEGLGDILLEYCTKSGRGTATRS